MKSNSSGHVYAAAYTVVACAPLIWSALFYGLAFYVSRCLGRWPIPMRDDPQFTVPNGFPAFIGVMVFILGMGLVVLLPLWIILAIFSYSPPFDRSVIPSLRIGGKRIDLALPIFLAGVSVLVVIGIWDPHHVFDWFLD
ncbi:MAG: hypothetical protein JWN14_3907 [Chthonomonadales bacterium]|nr:hypothetical protein [Chthonomonadales bacterium]